MKLSISITLTCLIVVVGCGGTDSPDKPSLMNAGNTGTGGIAAGSGGIHAGSGGVTAGSGGAKAPIGGTPAGSGGVGAGSGGAAGAPPIGSAGTGGQQSDGGIAMPDGGMMGGPIVPIIPEISGDCPEFTEGTSIVTVMGINATVIAGAKKSGTGSLLFYWYGTGGLGGVTSLPGAISDDIASQGGIVFAQNQAKNTGGDCSGTGTFGIDDFEVSDQVVACAVKNYGIDPKRIYATGCSAGGLTTGCMGIMRSNYIAAVAPNSGGITIGYGKLQNPMHMPNAITMNGGAGDNVIVNFGQTSEGYDNYVLKYGGFAVNCIHSFGHCGAPASVYGSAWQFLKDHPFGVTPEPYAAGLPSTFDPVCKIFEMTDMAPIGGF
jgi:hypothetical protein